MTREVVFRHGVLALMLMAALLLSACQRPEIHRDRFLAFGTLVELNVYTADPDLAREAAELVRLDLETMHEAWHAWQPSSLTRFNDMLASGLDFHPDPELLSLVEDVRRLYLLSDGLFNPGMANLFALWGFQSDEALGPPPDPQAIQELLDAAPGMDDLLFQDGMMRSLNPALRLDLGAYAKGYGVDRIMERLRGLGIEHAILNAGGDLRAMGRPGKRPWRIGVRDPDREQVLAAIEIEGEEAIFTSGDYERHFVYEGVRYHHILDPRTGQPARGTRSVTVIHDNAAEADAAATALFIAGPRDWPDIARRMGIDKVLLIDADGVAHMSEAMVRRVKFMVEPADTRIVPLTMAVMGGSGHAHRGQSL